jgi:hypothetical protein
VATAVLAVFAIVTAWYARHAYQAQSGQLEDQRALNRRQTPVLELQARELRESLGERKRQAGDRRRAQAARVFLAAPSDGRHNAHAVAQNTSDQPV